MLTTKLARQTVVIVMPELGLTTGEMPHVRFPPKNYMPSQALYFLYTACRNLGCITHVVDANWSKAPVNRILSFQPNKVFITTATPTLTGTLKIIRKLRQSGYIGEIYVGGPHISLNFLQRDFLLSDLTTEEGVTLLPTIKSKSTFDWVPVAFPGRSQFEVLGMNTAAAQNYLKTEFEREHNRKIAGRLEDYIFSYFQPTMVWMNETYKGSHLKERWKNIPIRHSIITSIGCSKTCSFCGNPYIYRIGFKSPKIVREILKEYIAQGIHRISVHDMYFLMHQPHALEMMKIFRESGVKYSMQTCLDDLTEKWLEDLKDSGLQKFLVGIENPNSYTVGKKVEIDKVSWLLKIVKEKQLEGVKLSYIVGLPGVSIENDFALLQHIIKEVITHGHPLYDLQVNLYTPYRPEPNT
ncbi:MAG: radical SAM protein, partial [Cyanobacteria bacterium J06635_15]